MRRSLGLFGQHIQGASGLPKVLKRTNLHPHGCFNFERDMRNLPLVPAGCSAHFSIYISLNAKQDGKFRQVSRQPHTQSADRSAASSENVYATPTHRAPKQDRSRSLRVSRDSKRRARRIAWRGTGEGFRLCYNGATKALRDHYRSRGFDDVPVPAQAKAVGELSAELRGDEVHQLRHALKSALLAGDSQAAFASFSELLDRGVLGTFECMESILMATSRPAHESEVHLQRFFELYCGQQYPASPVITRLLLSYLRKYPVDRRLQFAQWVLRVNGQYANPLVLGKIIDLFLESDCDLESCEKVYELSLSLYTTPRNRRVLQPNATVADAEASIRRFGKNGPLLTAIGRARLRHGHAQDGWLAFDNVLSVYPALGAKAVTAIVPFRPLHECLQLSSMAARAISDSFERAHQSLLGVLVRLQRAVIGKEVCLQASLTTLATVRSMVVDPQNSIEHVLSHLLCAAASLLPPRVTDPVAASSSNAIATELVSKVFDIYRALKVRPGFFSFCTLLSYGTRRSNEHLVGLALSLVGQCRETPIPEFWEGLLYAKFVKGGPTKVLEWWTAWSSSLGDDALLHKASARSLAEVLGVVAQFEDVFARKAYEPLQAQQFLLPFLQSRLKSTRRAKLRAIDDSDAQFATCMDHATTFLAALNRFETLIKSGEHRNLYANPPEHSTLLPAFGLPPEEWQRELFEEVKQRVQPKPSATPDEDGCTKSSDRAFENVQSSELPPVPWEAQERSSGGLPTPGPRGAAGGGQQRKSQRAAVSRLPTGWPRDKLYFQNWADMNNLMAFAADYDRRVQSGIDAGEWVPKRVVWPDLASDLRGLELAEHERLEKEQEVWLRRDVDIHVQQFIDGNVIPKDKEEWKRLVRSLRKLPPPREDKADLGQAEESA